MEGVHDTLDAFQNEFSQKQNKLSTAKSMDHANFKANLYQSS